MPRNAAHDRKNQVCGQDLKLAAGQWMRPSVPAGKATLQGLAGALLRSGARAGAGQQSEKSL